MTTKSKPNLRSGNKHAEARAWAYDMLADSPGTTGAEMAGLMVEQFGAPKQAMSHTLGQMLRVGILKSNGITVYKGKRTHMLSIASRRRRVAKEAAPEAAEPTPIPAANGNGHGHGVYIVIDTPEGQVKLTPEQVRVVSEVAELLK
jgi:hypothetical protein